VTLNSSCYDLFQSISCVPETTQTKTLTADHTGTREAQAILPNIIEIQHEKF
jgi:hypothetical protein